MEHDTRVKRRFRAGVWLRRGLLLLLAFVLIVGVPLAIHIDRYGLQDGAAPADVIVVLGAGLRRDGSPTGAMIRRTTHGAALYEAGYAPWMICSGGFTVNMQLSEAQVCADLLVGQGVPREAILLEEESRSTEENAIYTAAIMRERGWRTALVTSDNFHLWRATLLFEAQGLSVTTSPAQTTTGPIRRRDYVVSLSREVLALIWYTVKEALGLPFTNL